MEHSGRYISSSFRSRAFGIYPPQLFHILIHALAEHAIMWCLVSIAMWIWIDFASFLVHIVLDNDAFSQWPVLGAAVRSFLHHHKEPHLIAEKPFWLFVNEMSLPVAFVGWTQSLYFYSVGASSAWFAFIFLYFKLRNS